MSAQSWLSRLLALWLGSFAGLLAFLYWLLIGSNVGGRSMFEIVFR